MQIGGCRKEFRRGETRPSPPDMRSPYRDDPPDLHERMRCTIHPTTPPTAAPLTVTAGSPAHQTIPSPERAATAYAAPAMTPPATAPHATDFAALFARRSQPDSVPVAVPLHASLFRGASSAGRLDILCNSAIAGDSAAWLRWAGSESGMSMRNKNSIRMGRGMFALSRDDRFPRSDQLRDHRRSSILAGSMYSNWLDTHYAPPGIARTHRQGALFGESLLERPELSLTSKVAASRRVI